MAGNGQMDPEIIHWEQLEWKKSIVYLSHSQITIKCKVYILKLFIQFAFNASDQSNITSFLQFYQLQHCSQSIHYGHFHLVALWIYYAGNPISRFDCDASYWVQQPQFLHYLPQPQLLHYAFAISCGSRHRRYYARTRYDRQRRHLWSLK